MKKKIKILWSPLAVDRVSEITEYIANDSPNAANQWVDSLFQSIERLEQFPQSGRMLPEFNNPKLREILFGQYRIIYRIEGNTVSILTVRHGKQILPDEDIDQN